MAKNRMLNTRFWSDSWVREKLNALDRYFFLYLLLNERANISGIYELPVSTMALETGIDKDEILKSMFPNLKPKVYYKDGWVIIPNFPKHQNLKSPKIMVGIRAELEVVPEKIKDAAIGYGYPMDTLSHSNSNSNPNSNSNKNYSSSFEKLGKKQKPYYDGQEMRMKNGKWWVIPAEGGSWLEFADSEDKIDWR